MPRYFFTIHRQDQVDDDPDGTYLPDAEAAFSCRYSILVCGCKRIAQAGVLIQIKSDQGGGKRRFVIGTSQNESKIKEGRWWRPLSQSDRKEFRGNKPGIALGDPPERSNEPIKSATRLDLRQAKYRASVCSHSPMMRARHGRRVIIASAQLRQLGDIRRNPSRLIRTRTQITPVALAPTSYGLVEPKSEEDETS